MSEKYPRGDIDSILAQLNAGEIKPGYKGIDKLSLPGQFKPIEVNFNRLTNELSFTNNGIHTEAIVRDGKLVQLEIFDADTRNALYDAKSRQKQGELIMTWLGEGLL